MSLTLRGMVSSQSGKLITLAALPTHSTITVANICTEIHEEISVDTCLVLRCGVSLVNKKRSYTYHVLVLFRHISTTGT